ncbi:aromatic compound dioxygenase [Desarmillaria tabescens]|uniref:Aromatic compound dioxygenase n=1 Tax=Armillaria tabescens TaxID=1929756 RepID=A0AA39NNR6_ARMTA|nr:aromatic compound dioxygenase [Desarmillaria tabescens]KAK0469045.1 aromatic compound dioxygenase [Desarmillaria tabescens]
MVSAWSTLILVASAVMSVTAHASPAPVHWKRDNLVVRESLEKRCGDILAARRRKRALHVSESLWSRGSYYMPRTTSSNDSTCFVTPEVTQGPYHILGEIVRQNMTEGQAGIPLEISADFIDINTCDPVQVWVDAWHANATGFYAGYIAETGSYIAGGDSGEGSGDVESMSGSAGGSFGGSGAYTQTTTSATTSYGAYSGADSTSAASMLNTPVDDNSTFLRGVWQSDEDGHLTMYSIFPGWYSQRAQHFHIKIYPEGEIAANGTFIAGGSAVHAGQFFFDNDTLQAVAANSIYAANAISWSDSVSNEDDQWYPYQSATGYNANMDITWVGDDITDGLIGTITVALNLSYTSVELSTQFAAFDVEEYEAEGLLPSASLSL